MLVDQLIDLCCEILNVCIVTQFKRYKLLSLSGMNLKIGTREFHEMERLLIHDHSVKFVHLFLTNAVGIYIILVRVLGHHLCSENGR